MIGLVKNSRQESVLFIIYAPLYYFDQKLRFDFFILLREIEFDLHGGWKKL